MGWISYLLLGFGPLGFLVAGLLAKTPWLGIEPIFLVMFGLLGFVVGSIVGDRQGRVWLGAALGVALGVAGWVIVAMLPGPTARPGSDSG